MNHTIMMVPVDLIDPHPHNPRRVLGDLTEERAEAAVERVRELHSVRSCGDSSCEHCRCRGCGEPWPCPTSRALGGAS